MISVPSVHAALDFVLATVVGHLFGYEAARAIDALADPLRQAHAAIETAAAEPRAGDDLLDALVHETKTSAALFFEGLAAGSYNGQMEASTAARLTSLLRYALGMTPLESFALEHGQLGTPALVIEELAAALTKGIEELTRPVDAIKHQAKTVTVGISRADEDLLSVPLVAELLAAGAPRDQIAYRDLRTLAAIDPAVEKVLGHTRYEIHGDARNGRATIEVVGQGGSAQDVASRHDHRPDPARHQAAGGRRAARAGRPGRQRSPQRGHCTGAASR